MINLEAIVALILELKKSKPLTEFEYFLYEAACDFLTKELKSEELEDVT